MFSQYRPRGGFFVPRREFWVWCAVGFMLAIAAVAVVTSPAFPAERCMASFYGSESGKWTASGERFNPNGMTAAHKTLPFGTWIGVRAYGRLIRVRINDRGPFVRGRCLDLASGAARALGMRGTAVVEIDWPIEDRRR